MTARGHDRSCGPGIQRNDAAIVANTKGRIAAILAIWRNSGVPGGHRSMFPELKNVSTWRLIDLRGAGVGWARLTSGKIYDPTALRPDLAITCRSQLKWIVDTVRPEQT